jgi:hypothetical protein
MKRRILLHRRRQPQCATKGRLGIAETTDRVEVTGSVEELLDLWIRNLDGVP